MAQTEHSPTGLVIHAVIRVVLEEERPSFGEPQDKAKPERLLGAVQL